MKYCWRTIIPVVRRGLKATIEEDEGLRVIAQAVDGNDAMRQIIELRPAVAILDIDMPGLNGLGVAREVSAQKIDTRIVFMTFHADEDLMRAAMDVGGKGYLLKGSETDEVAAAIHAVFAGRTYIGSTMAAILLKQKTESPGSAQLLDISGADSVGEKDPSADCRRAFQQGNWRRAVDPLPNGGKSPHKHVPQVKHRRCECACAVCAAASICTA